MRRTPPTRPRRRGATTVETAVVISVALLFIFGILEYARLLYFFHVADNAAREGARYAVVHTGDGTKAGTKTDVPVFDATGQFQAPNTSVAAVVNYAMNGQQSSLSGTYNVNVSYADPNTGLAKAGSWSDAPFSGTIGVEVTGTYSFILPTFLRFSGPTLSIRVRSLMNSEAN
jgi:Flp pilus assembly protein TadG